MRRGRWSAPLIWEVYELRDEDLDSFELPTDDLLYWYVLGVRSNAITDSAKDCFVVDIRRDLYLQKGFLLNLDTKLRRMNAIQASLNDWMESGHRALLHSLWKTCLDDIRKGPPEEPSGPSIPAHAVTVSAVVLLPLVYHYLTGNVDRGGSKAYSRSSLDFRDIYVAIVLFLGAYVWIKFREVAFKGVYPRKLRDKQGGTKVMYEARLKPPMWNNERVPRLDLGRFATQQEAHNRFLIAAFYYNRGAGLLDGWFQVPPMSEEQLRFTGKEKRKWVIGQTKKVYEDFEKEAALLLQELFEGCEVQATPGHDEVNVDPCGTSLLDPAEPQQLVRLSQAENSKMGMAMIGDNHGLECASQSFDGMHEGLALRNDHSLGSQEGSARPVPQLPANTERVMSLVDGSDQLDLLQTRVRTLQQQISLLQQQSSLQQQQISDQQQQISLQQRQIQDFGAQILQFQNQQGIQPQQQLPESSIQYPQWSYRFYLQEQQLQDVNQGSSVFEMEQSMHQQNYPGLMTPPPDGGKAQEGLWELDTLV